MVRTWDDFLKDKKCADCNSGSALILLHHHRPTQALYCEICENYVSELV